MPPVLTTPQTSTGLRFNGSKFYLTLGHYKRIACRVGKGAPHHDPQNKQRPDP